jgi:cardiolipin synthase
MSLVYTYNNQVSLIKNGEDFYQEVISLIQSAKKCIFLHMYIFTYDEDTKPLIELLKDKANEGVDIYLILDGFGSKSFDTQIISELRQVGVNFSFFSPVTAKKLGSIGRRLHQKVILIDSEKALIGGTNISQEYINPLNDSPWLDYACVISGEAIATIQEKIKRIYLHCFPHKAASIEMLLNLDVKLHGKTKVMVVENDYTRLKREVQWSYHKLIRNAKKRVVITATYFHPGRKFLKVLRQARKRGVEIELIFGSRSDIPSYSRGARFLFGWYLRYGIKIFIWNKSIIHGKLALIDDTKVNLGSYNHNIISQYANLEMNAVIDDQAFASIVANEIDEIKSHCHEVTPEEFKKVSFFTKVGYYFYYIFSTFFDSVQTLLITRK